MTHILAYVPTFSPNDEAAGMSRPYTRQSNEEIKPRLRRQSRVKPSVYFDAIDSVLNNPTPIDLVVGDGRSTESIRDGLKKHWQTSGGYELKLYPEKMSQWIIFNDILKTYAKPETEYFVYTSSDIIWTHDWIAEAIKAFEKDLNLQILFPCVSKGDGNLPCQIATGPRDIDPFDPPFQRAARAPVLNMYAGIFRMSFLRAYGGYPTVYKNCFTESYLSYMCEPIIGRAGGIKVLPRGWVYHHSALDVWHDDGGSTYNYHSEKPTFDKMMDEVLAARAEEKMTVCFLKDILKCDNASTP